MRPFLCLLLGALTLLPMSGRSVEFSSGSRKVSLIELFTSEGCSSCPPAEAWLSGLTTHPRLWRDFVPIAFHVDYWNRLGWRDEYSNAANTQRQYAYAEVWKTSSVYTPCFVRDGAEWRGSRDLSPTPAEPGALTVAYVDGKLTATFGSGHRVDSSELQLYAAILVGGIASKITAGENRGATLRHEFVAARTATGSLNESIALAQPLKRPGERHALAVWLIRRGDLVPLQATGGWLE